MAYKLIAIDIDETLLTHEGTIPQRVMQAIQKAKNKGIYVVLCTGRTKKGAQKFYDTLELDTLLISAGGAEVFDADGKILYAQPIDPSLVKQILAYAYENGIHAQVYIDGELVYKEKSGYSKQYEKSYGYPGIVMSDIMEQERIITPKVLYVTEQGRIKDIKNQVGKLFPTLTITRSLPTYLEFMHPDVDKGKALAYVADYYHIDRSDIIAVGDNEIDIPMLQYAGLSAVVANASRSVQKAADIVCASNQEGGVADVIEKYILEGLV
ncbi:MAG: Cof-type HAD-IIB family hydrolase [Eubacteriales bacterium]|nr:Cof-type HAD-IIB family hydrolase [Eubacteriales bacterium]